MEIKMSPNNSPVVCDGYVKYRKADIDTLVHSGPPKTKCHMSERRNKTIYKNKVTIKYT